MRRFVWIGVFSLVAAIFLGRAFVAQGGDKTASSMPEGWILIGTLKDFPSGTIKPVPEHKIIVFSDPQGIYAIASECTHKKCIVGVRKKEGILVCPCHGAKYTFDGVVTKGPATADLSWRAVSLEEDGQLFVHLYEVVPTGTRFVPKQDK